MKADERLAEIISALEGVGLTCLVMGGHAARYYGIDRNTIDFDLHLSPERWDELPQLLARSTLFSGQAVSEGPSWRPLAFRRFSIGRLPDGREEWLEFWKTNHLLPPFAELYARREAGIHGGRVLAFLALPDLIRSKETERNTDWQDVALLEEILDARLLAQADAGQIDLVHVLAQLRGRRGFERLLQLGRLTEPASVRQALMQARSSITQAFLLPFVSEVTDLPLVSVPIEYLIVNRLRSVVAGSSLHILLVEAVRRQYKSALQAADRADKKALFTAQTKFPPPASA